MEPEKPEFKKEMAVLGRGVRRTFLRDVVAVVAGAGSGALLGLIVSLLTVVSLQSAVKIGALLGAFIALAARSLFVRLFEYDKSPPE